MNVVLPLGEWLESPSVLERLGIGVVAWEHAVRATSRRFMRELDIMQARQAEARPRV